MSAQVPPDPRESAPSKRGRCGRARQALLRVGSAACLGGVFVAAAASAVVLHLDLAPARRIVCAVANDVLGSIFEGKIVISEVDHIGLNRLDIHSAVAIHPSGEHVIVASGIRARVDLLSFARRALLGSDELVVAIPLVHIRSGDVLLDRGATGAPLIAETFALKTRAPTKPRAPSEPGRPVRVMLDRIELDRAWAHGAVAPPRELDADVHRLVGAVRVTPAGVSVDVDRTGLLDRAFLPAPTSGTANYHLRVEFPQKTAAGTGTGAEPEVRMWSEFAGRVGAVEVVARAELDQGHLSATAELPRAAPEELSTWISGYPVREPIFASLSIDGDIPRFDVTGRVAAVGTTDAGGDVRLQGGIDAAGPVRMDLDLAARDVALALFDRDLPPTVITADGRLRVELGTEWPRLSVDARSEPTRFGVQPLPAAEVHLVLDRGVLSGTTRLLEEGMPTQGSFVFARGQGVHFDVATEIPNIDAAPRIAGPIKGAASVRARGSFHKGEIDADVEGSFSELRAGDGVALGHGRLKGRLSGPPDKLSLDATLTGTDLRAGAYDFGLVTAHARGPAAAPKLEAHLEGEAGDTIDASGQLDTKTRGIRGISVQIDRAGQKVAGQIARIGPRPGGIAIEGVKIRGEGVGSIEGGLAIRNKDITGTLRGDGIDLDRLAKLLGIPYRVRGIANVDVVLERGDKGRNGHILVELENGELPLLSGVSANVSALFENDALTTAGMVRLVAKAGPGELAVERCDGTIAQVAFSRGEGHLAGPLLDPATWAKLAGSVHVEAKDWNLRCLSRLMPIGLPISALGGTLSTRFDVLRDKGQRFPSVHNLAMRTRQLEVAGRHPLGAEAPEWESTSTDVLVQGNINGASGAADLAVTLFDDQRLADLAITAELDLPTLFDKPDRRIRSLLGSNMSARFSLPRRKVSSFATLPAFLSKHLPPVAGEIELSGHASGTPEQPLFTVRGKGYGITHVSNTAGEPSPWALPLDVEALVTYEASGAPLRAQAVVSRAGNAIARGRAEIETKGAQSDWTGGFRVELLGIPLGEIPFFADRDIAGNLKGIVVASGLNRDPAVSVKLDMPNLKLGPEVLLKSGTVAVDIQPVQGTGRSRAFVTADILARDGGRLSTNAYCGIAWQDRLVPRIDPDSPADLLAHATKLRLAMLEPFVAGTLSKLDGQLNGTVRVGFRRLGDGEQGRVDAYMNVTGGVVHIPQLGQELRDARMTIISNPLGVVRFENVEAKGVSGKLRGWALARFDGLRFQNAEGELVIAPEDAIPLTLEGVPLGTAYGKLRFEPDPTQQPGEIAAIVKVPSLHLQLPAATGKNVQSLEENPDFTLNQPLGQRVKKQTRRKDALSYRLTFLVDQMRVEGTGIDATIASVEEAPPRVEISEKTLAGGQIEILRGKFEVFSKIFEIERGLVRMREEDTSNPYVNLTAHWDAPDGTRVFVDFNGTLRPFTDDKLRFRSNPPKSNEEILATLLFGTDTASASTSTTPEKSSMGQMAGGVAVDLMAAQFNSLFSSTPFRAKVGTTEEGALKTGVVYEIGETVTAGASVEAPSSSEGTGRAEVNIDWRFKRNWTLRGTFGIGADQPSSGIDVLWQYRY